MKTASIILAAGQSKRMVSDLPKVLHKLNGKPLIEYSIAAAVQAVSETPVIVIGNAAELVPEFLRRCPMRRCERGNGRAQRKSRLRAARAFESTQPRRRPDLAKLAAANP